MYLTLVGEFGGGDVQLLVLLPELGEVDLQVRLLQPGGVQQALKALVLRLQLLVLPQKLLVGLVQPAGWRRWSWDSEHRSNVHTPQHRNSYNH